MAAQAIAAAKARKAAAERELQLSREEANRAWQLERELAKLEATQPGGQRRHQEDALRATKIAAEAEERAREAAEVRRHQAAAAKAIVDADEEKRMAMLASEAAQESRAADLLVRISAQIRRQQAEKYARRPQTAPRFFFSGIPGEPATRAELRGRPHVSATRRCAARSPRRVAATASPRAAAVAAATAAQSSTAPFPIAVTGAAPSLEEAASLPPTSLPAPPSLAAAAAVDVTPPPTPPPAPKHAPSPPRRNRSTSPVLLQLTPLLSQRKPYSPALSVPSPDSPDRIKGEVMVREVVVRGMGGLTERPDPWIHERREPAAAAAPRRPSASPSTSPRSGTSSPRSYRHAAATTRPYTAAAASQAAAVSGGGLATRPPSSFGSRPSSSGLKRDEAEARARRALGATLGAGGALGAALQAVEVREVSPVEEQAVGIRVERARLRVQAENCRAAVHDFGREAEVVRAQRAFEEEKCAATGSVDP